MINFIEFEKKFREAIDLGSVELLDENTKLENIKKWDSLAVMSVIVMMDSDFNIWLSASDIRELKTLGDLYKKINKDS